MRSSLPSIGISGRNWNWRSADCRRISCWITLKEIAPFAYNKGVSDAESYFRTRVEDLSGACYEAGLGYWQKRRR